MKSFINRNLKSLNLRQFNKNNKPLLVGSLELNTPEHRQYILRCLIKRPFEELALPNDLEWVKPVVELAFNNQKKMGISQPFCYLTIRNGVVDTVTDDEWHTDGFSTTITHLPEQNYLWASHTPTEYVIKKVNFPEDFDPMVHNIHNYIQDTMTVNDKVRQLKPKSVYCSDPYFIHRRPVQTQGLFRTFIRVSFTPIEINDVNNTYNPILPTNYCRDAVKEFRNKLERYPAKVSSVVPVDNVPTQH